jgi:hypothetical protein
MADNADQSGEKETFNIGLNEHGIALLIGQDSRITRLHVPVILMVRLINKPFLLELLFQCRILQLPYVPQQFSGEFLFVGRTH